MADADVKGVGTAGEAGAGDPSGAGGAGGSDAGGSGAGDVCPAPVDEGSVDPEGVVCSGDSGVDAGGVGRPDESGVGEAGGDVGSGRSGAGDAVRPDPVGADGAAGGAGRTDADGSDAGEIAPPPPHDARATDRQTASAQRNFASMVLNSSAVSQANASTPPPAASSQGRRQAYPGAAALEFSKRARQQIDQIFATHNGNAHPVGRTCQFIPFIQIHSPLPTEASILSADKMEHSTEFHQALHLHFAAAMNLALSAGNSCRR